MQKILVVSHCILNPASKVTGYNEAEAADEEAGRRKLLGYVMENDIRLIQLPCPEMTLYGAARWGHVKEQFMHPYYRRQCRSMLESVILQLKEYLSYPERFQVLAVVAIDGSPSCGYKLTCRGNWGGELTANRELNKKIRDLYMAPEAGVFMEELEKLFAEEDINIPIKDLRAMIEELY